MNNLVLLLLILLPGVSFGQQTKKVKDKVNNESYYVLKSDNITKHGLYQQFSYKNKPLVKGFYKLGVKDSVWECYDFAGTLTLKYDYTKQEVVFYKPSDEHTVKKYRIVGDSSSLNQTLSRPPIYLYGEDWFLLELGKGTRYPSEARNNRKSGTVYVKFTVDKYGKTGNYYVETPLGFGLDEEAIRGLKKVPDNWLPGQVNGQPVDVEVVYPIKFSLR